MKTSSKKVRTTEQVLKEQEAQAKADRERALAIRRKGVAALAADSSNVWLEVAAELDKFVGAPFVKFTKQGEYAITDTETIPLGTRCLAHVDEAELGWRKWADGKPIERRMGRVADCFVPPRRNELGDTDESQWETDDDGNRRDPWQFCESVPVGRLDTGETYLFMVSSKGGLRCVNGLMRTYGTRVKQKGAAAGLPVIELRADSYKHRQYGKIFVPLLHIVNWTDSADNPLSLADEIDDGIPDFDGRAA